MKRNGILNRELCEVIASMGHTDMLIVCYAGFPVPRDAHRVDLALVADIPDLRTVIRALSEELIVEGVVIAGEMEEFNPPLFAWLHERFRGAKFELRPHNEVLSSVAHEAKAIVRTGAFEPWGNVGLVSGVDVPRWFSRDGVRVPDYYRDLLGVK